MQTAPLRFILLSESKGRAQCCYCSKQVHCLLLSTVDVSCSLAGANHLIKDDNNKTALDYATGPLRRLLLKNCVKVASAAAVALAAKAEAELLALLESEAQAVQQPKKNKKGKRGKKQQQQPQPKQEANAVRAIGDQKHSLLPILYSYMCNIQRSSLLIILHAGADGEAVHDEEPAADTALHLAAQRGDEADILRLLKRGECVNVRGCADHTPLVRLLAFYEPSWEMDIDCVVQEMIAAGADRNIPDENHNTALMVALNGYKTSACQARKDRVPASVCITLIEAGQ